MRDAVGAVALVALVVLVVWASWWRVSCAGGRREARRTRECTRWVWGVACGSWAGSRHREQEQGVSMSMSMSMSVSVLVSVSVSVSGAAVWNVVVARCLVEEVRVHVRRVPWCL